MVRALRTFFLVLLSFGFALAGLAFGGYAGLLAAGAAVAAYALAAG